MIPVGAITISQILTAVVMRKMRILQSQKRSLVNLKNKMALLI
jgi:hypothetical protein